MFIQLSCHAWNFCEHSMCMSWCISVGMCTGIAFLGPRTCISAAWAQSCQFSEVIAEFHTSLHHPCKSSSCPTSSLALGFSLSYVLATLMVCVSHCDLIGMFLLTNLPFWYLCDVSVLLGYFPVGLSVFFLLICRSELLIYEGYWFFVR